jgi:glycosyltransferase involved in cell wall biosynthesis
MRIHLLITQDLESPSGLGRYWPMAKSLSRLGHTVTISALHSDYTHLTRRHFSFMDVAVNYIAPMHIQKTGSIKRYYSPVRLILLSIRATFQFFRYGLATPTDLIHICKPHPMNSIPGILVGRLKKIPVLLDCDDVEVGIGNFQRDWMRRVIRAFENWTPTRVDMVSTNTFYNKERIMRLGIPESNVAYIPNGIDPDRSRIPDPTDVNKKKTELNLQGNTIVTYIGTLGLASHPVDLLVEAYHEIRKTISNSRLLLVGGGEDIDRLKEQVIQLGIEGEVIFTGRVNPQDVPLYYALSDVSVDPIQDDLAARGRSPLKMFESWAAGVPFVTSDVGDRQQLIGDPPAGLLAQPGDSRSLADAILRVLRDHSLAEILIRAGRERAATYSWDKLGVEMESVYRRVLDRSSLAL